MIKRRAERLSIKIVSPVLAVNITGYTQLLNVKCEFHLRVDAALDHEVARILEDQNRLLAGFLIAGVEGEQIGFDESVMYCGLVAVDEDDRVAPTQEDVRGIIVPPLLQDDADDVGETGLCGTQSEPSRRKQKETGAERTISEIEDHR